MTDNLSDFLVESFQFLPPELIVILLSAMPILELRGGIPVGILTFGMEPIVAMMYALIGNILPNLPIMLFFRPISKWMLQFSFYRQFYDWLYDRTMKKSGQIEKFGALGLVLFTAVPLPTTGAYSACLAAILFFIPIKFAFFSISVGVVIAGGALTLMTYFLT
ncbi:COG2426 family protein [Halalkalibacter nanhaiisediminis]|uniref:Putative membrane protein n=1 Tax=Halalkalibacter nanhaiisediminis TaxID=688079 RepID=A0A562QHN4_9BACI|nr:small multi-drug export protein [Halalkalibacter nanhaiisediminis]TWI56267.1 putative membrane protein [Halalkalibacter nanhaiisediminis]